MKEHSRLFTDFIDIFLGREFQNAISASRDERRREDLGLTKYAVRGAIAKGQFEPDKPRIIERVSPGPGRKEPGEAKETAERDRVVKGRGVIILHSV